MQGKEGKRPPGEGEGEGVVSAVWFGVGRHGSAFMRCGVGRQ